MHRFLITGTRLQNRYGFSVHETHTPPFPSPTQPLSSIIIKAILGGTIATTGELCLVRYLANSEEVISKNLVFCLYTQLLLLF